MSYTYPWRNKKRYLYVPTTDDQSPSPPPQDQVVPSSRAASRQVSTPTPKTHSRILPQMLCREDQFICAAFAGDFAVVAEMLRETQDLVKYTDHRGRTALYSACRNASILLSQSQPLVVKELLFNHADGNIAKTGGSGGTCAHALGLALTEFLKCTCDTERVKDGTKIARQLLDVLGSYGVNFIQPNKNGKQAKDMYPLCEGVQSFFTEENETEVQQGKPFYLNTTTTDQVTKHVNVLPSSSSTSSVLEQVAWIEPFSHDTEVVVKLSDTVTSQFRLSLVARLPNVLEITETKQFRYDSSNNTFHVFGTKNQMQKMKTICAALQGVYSFFFKRREELRRKVIEEYRGMALRMQRNPHILDQRDETLKKHLIDYFTIFVHDMETTCDDKVRQLQNFWDKTHEVHCANLTMDDPTNAPALCDQSLTEQLTRLLDDAQIRNAPQIALQKLFDAVTHGRDGLTGSFLKFRREIEERASKCIETDLPILLRDFQLHFLSSQRSLPVYEEVSSEIITKVCENDIVLVTSGTGSGKTTQIPLLLLASGLGYKSIAVTQPRRLAAESICHNVEKMYGTAVVGYCIAGVEHNPRAPIVYYTDGLLRSYLSMDKEIPFDVIIIDEVHERSKDADACIAILALVAKEKRFRCPKIILASATFDKSVVGPFTRAGMKVGEVIQQPTIRYRVTDHQLQNFCPTPTCNICTHLRTCGHYYLDCVLMLWKQLQGTEQQLLLFLPTHIDVNEAIIALKGKHINAHPLFADQPESELMENVAQGRVLVSTNISETSLTFPNLRYVVDCGTVQRPRETQHGSLLEVVPAPFSTLKQRRGRVGRTCDGHYIALYEPSVKRDEFPQPKALIEGMTDTVFRLQMQLKREVDLDFPFLADNIVKIERLPTKFYAYPALEDLQMAHAFDTALTLGGSFDILCLTSLRKKCTRNVLAKMVSALQSPTRFGDISSITGFMVRLVSTQFNSELSDRGGLETEIENCVEQGLKMYSRQLTRAYIDARRMIDHCEKNGIVLTKCEPDNPMPMIHSLAQAFFDNIFLACPIFGGPTNYYSRAIHFGDGGDDNNSSIQTFSSIYSKSTLVQGQQPKQHQCVLCLDFVLFGAELTEDKQIDPFRLGVMRMCESIEHCPLLQSPSHLIHRRIETLPTNQDILKDEGDIGMTFWKCTGTIQSVMDSARAFLSETTVRQVIDIRPPKEPALRTQFEVNVKRLRPEMFRPMTLLWANKYQVEIGVDLTNSQFKIACRPREVETLQQHIYYWIHQLQRTVAVHYPYDFAVNSNFSQPSYALDTFKNRLRLVTSTSLSKEELWHMTCGSNSSRELRMAAVCRVALSYRCRVVGGFVRDWVVRGDTVANVSPTEFVQPGKYTTYEIKEGVLPKDLDIELPSGEYFDPLKFIQEVRDLGIEIDHYEYVPQRHVFLFERRRGAFTADFIEHHYAALHTQVDFDVNALCLMSGYENQMGLKVRMARLNVDDVIQLCLRKHFHSKRPLDDNVLMSRKEKMEQRGWIYDGPDDEVPTPPSGYSSVVQLHSPHPVYEKWAEHIREIGGSKIKIFEIIQHASGQQFYDFRKSKIGNERELFHGTKNEIADKIMHEGFDLDHCSPNANFGRGAYFADDLDLSLTFTSRGVHKTVFVCNVLLGRSQVIPEINAPLGANFRPKPGYDSVEGRVWIDGDLRQTEYVVYDSTQVVPYLRIGFQLHEEEEEDEYEWVIPYQR